MVNTNFIPFSEPASLDDPDEMAFLKTNLEKMSPGEVKSLVHYSFGRIMDLKMRGRDLDINCDASEALNNELKYRLQRERTKSQLEKEEYKKIIFKQQQDFNMKLLKLMDENQKMERYTKRLEEKKDQYKEYYLLHRQSERNRNEEPSDDEENADEIKTYNKSTKTSNNDGNESKKVTFANKGKKIIIKKPSSDTMPDHRKSSKKHK